MKTKLSLLERRAIAKNSLVYADWFEILKNTHRKETYDKFNIPLYKEDVDKYFLEHKTLNKIKQ